MNLGINGKTVLVVGASKGIGREIALSFAREKCRVIALARNEDLLQSLILECESFSCLEHEYYVADVMNQNTIEIANDIMDSYGEIDIVIQNIGSSLTSRDPLAGFQAWEYALRLNAGSAIDMNSVFIPRMIEQGWGRIVHISSISAMMLRGNPLYAASKAFLNAYVMTTGRAIANSGVVLSAVMPGAVVFEGSYWHEALNTQPEKCSDFLRHHQAIGRFGTCREIADMVLFLASELSSFMPGSIVPVDGANM